MRLQTFGTPVHDYFIIAQPILSDLTVAKIHLKKPCDWRSMPNHI